ncbi:MAG TPA: hypothetical protein VII61_06110 [Ktedonobacteraceae bacterium]
MQPPILTMKPGENRKKHAVPRNGFGKVVEKSVIAFSIPSQNEQYGMDPAQF